MALVNLTGSGIWVPTIPVGYFGSTSGAQLSPADSVVDADEEEIQIIGQITIDGGGSKTFGTSGSKISWFPGTTITFSSGSTLTVGIKTGVDFTAGPPSRATIGAAAFGVYKALVGGTDTITATTWRNDSMASGTPFTITDGDTIAICWHLDVTSGSPSVKVRGGVVGGPLIVPGFGSVTLVTSGPTYTNSNVLPNCIVTFDDGTIGWIEPTITSIQSAIDLNAGAAIGSGNIQANIMRFPFSCKIDAIAANLTPANASADFNFELYQTPFGTPTIVESIAVDANVMSTTNNLRFIVRRLSTPRTLSINTDYAIGVKQTTANGVTTHLRDNNDASFAKAVGMGADCYAVFSTAGATFSDSLTTKRRRYHIYARISALDDGTGSAGGGMLPSPTMNGGLV